MRHRPLARMGLFAVLLAALFAPPATASADMFNGFPPPPQLRVSVDGTKPMPTLGQWCWDRASDCLHFDYAPCVAYGGPNGLVPQPPPCGPALVRRGAVLAIYTRWGAESLRVTLWGDSIDRKRGWVLGEHALRTYRSGDHRFLVRVPRAVRREVAVTFDVRYRRGLTASWYFDLKPKNQSSKRQQ